MPGPNPKYALLSARNYLMANLPDRLRDINADIDVPTDETDQWNDPLAYFFGVVDSPPRYPAIDIGVPDFEGGDLDNFRGTPRSGKWRFPVIIRAQIQHPDYFTLTSWGYDYGEAMILCLLQREALPEWMTVIELRGFFGVNPEIDERQQFTARIVVGLRIEHEFEVKLQSAIT